MFIFTYFFLASSKVDRPPPPKPITKHPVVSQPNPTEQTPPPVTFQKSKNTSPSIPPSPPSLAEVDEDTEGDSENNVEKDSDAGNL